MQCLPGDCPQLAEGCRRNQDQVTNHPAFEASAAGPAAMIWAAHEGSVQSCWDGLGEKSHRQTNRSRVVGAQAGLGVPFVGMQSVQSWPFPARPQEAEKLVRAMPSILALQAMPLTTSSSPSSRLEGSGIGPSITQRLVSYLVRMKFSILLW